MKRSTFFFSVMLSLLTPVYLSAQESSDAKNCTPCEQLMNLRLPDVTILQAKAMQTDTIEGQVIKVPFCRLLGRISKEINFELLLPNAWNERFLMSGGGGFVGAIQNSFRDKVNLGYATAGTDAGHKGSGLDASWGLDNMERQLDFGKLAVHLTAVVSKSIVNSYYCKAPAYSYFMGCSRGGGQAMVEAQFYPGDFEGIVCGAPAFDWPGTGAKLLQISQKNYPDPKNLKTPVITRDNLYVLQDEVLKQCDTLDGVKDGIVSDPRGCKFDFSRLPVSTDTVPAAGYFTTKQLEAIKTVYTPLVNKQGTIYPGYPFGAENAKGGWDLWIAGNYPGANMPSLHYLFSTGMFKYLVFNDPSWDYSKYDFSNFFKDTKYASAYLNATQTDYTEFKKLNRKMIMYHGWNDPALSAFSTVSYYDDVAKKDQDVQSYIRLFLLPGVLHCNGGPGPDEVDWLTLIRKWVEQGKAPERVVMSKKEGGKITMTRPVFPYPKVAVYKGKGDPNLETSFKEAEE
ncbi:MAG TPA: tannase/feruloyl esterase family alpha/beta hydrolase [Mucilaginibacter sp.]|nr:tannase/feruloyl esterase family alpha/beta hydrolase [Mucilaginibacter sp.]